MIVNQAGLDAIIKFAATHGFEYRRAEIDNTGSFGPEIRLELRQTQDIPAPDIRRDGVSLPMAQKIADQGKKAFAGVDLRTLDDDPQD